MKTGCVFLVLAIGCAAQQPISTGSLNFAGAISGSLLGADGTLIEGGLVHLTLLPPIPAGRRLQTEWTATSDGDGVFDFGALNDGTYSMCVYAPSGPWLDPCRWGLNPAVVSLSVSQPSASPTITLDKGAVITIRVNDPGQLLSQNEAKTPRGRC